MKNLKYFLKFGTLTLAAMNLVACSYQSRLPLGQSTFGPSSSKVVMIQATATDNVGVTKVDFYVNGVLTCTVLKAPYTCPWSVPPGAGIQYKLQTKAYDAQGNVGTSQIVTVTSG